MSHLKNVAIVGATGRIGSYITNALLAEGNQTVTAITRPENTAEMPPGVVVKRVDYSSHSSLVEALKGQDALIITMSIFAAADSQSKLVQAAAEAGVQWILPNEWGSDSTHPFICKNPMLPPKVAILKEIEQLGKSNYIAFVNNQWWEWSLGGGFYGIDIPNRKVTLYDDGHAKTVTTTWARVGESVAKLLALPVSGSSPCLEDFKNKHVYANSFYLSQREMLAAVQRYTGTTDKDWEFTDKQAVPVYQTALEELTKGNFAAAIDVIYAGNFVPDSGNDYIHTKDSLNKVLGLPDENVDVAVKSAVDYSKVHKSQF